MSESDSSPSHAGLRSLAPRQWANLAMLTLSMFIIVLDVTVVLIALPAIRQDLGATLDLAAWVPGAFILTFAGLLLLFGKLADLYGRRRLFVIGMTVFTLASVASALAPSIEVLIGARVVQGIGAAIVEPAIIAVIKATFPSDKLGLAFGIEGQAAGLASVVGPIVGGVLTSSLGWESIFWINVPIGVVAVGMALLLISESRDEHASRRIDVPGVIFSGAGLFALVFAIVEGQRFGWASPAIVGSFIAAVVLLALFIVTERAGLGAQYGPTTSGSLRNIPTARAGVASAVSYAAVTLGFELGIAVTSAVQQTQTAPEVTGVEAANLAILACAALTLVGAIVAVFFTAKRTRHVTPTMAYPTSTVPDPGSQPTSEG